MFDSSFTCRMNHFSYGREGEFDNFQAPAVPAGFFIPGSGFLGVYVETVVAWILRGKNM